MLEARILPFTVTIVYNNLETYIEIQVDIWVEKMGKNIRTGWVYCFLDKNFVSNNCLQIIIFKNNLFSENIKMLFPNSI